MGIDEPTNQNTVNERNCSAETHTRTRVHHSLNKFQTLTTRTSDNLRSTQLKLSSLSTFINGRWSPEEFVKGKLLDELSPRVRRGFVFLDVGCPVSFVVENLLLRSPLVNCVKWKIKRKRISVSRSFGSHRTGNRETRPQKEKKKQMAAFTYIHIVSTNKLIIMFLRILDIFLGFII